FTILRHTAAIPVVLSADNRCHVLMGLSGAMRVGGSNHQMSLDPGETALIPSSALPVPLTPAEPSQFLEVFWD
ncbi:MAG TPA: hypothetical protein VL475_07155, partial [Planctomycetaceae bacterium]|nr:hypothetical protein [Planctomycetaceae bacterium]